MDKKTVPTHADIIGWWPSFKAFSDEVDANYVAVHNWLTRNSIPSKYWTRVVANAHARDLPVTYKLLAEGCAIQEKELINPEQ